CQQGISNPLTF
nr:immunoglobulin light chain junction region [Macaca mulatta]